MNFFFSPPLAHITYISGVQVTPEAPGAGTPGCAHGHGALGCAGSRSSGAVLPDCTGTGCRDGGVGFGLFLSNILSFGMLNENIQSQTKGLMYFWLQQK